MALDLHRTASFPLDTLPVPLSMAEEAPPPPSIATRITVDRVDRKEKLPINVFSEAYKFEPVTHPPEEHKAHLPCTGGDSAPLPVQLALDTLRYFNVWRTLI